MTTYELDHLLAGIHAMLDGREFSYISDGWSAWSFYAAQGEW